MSGDMRSEVGAALAAYDKALEACPARKRSLGSDPCPKCRAGPQEGCGLDAGESYKLIERLRALSTPARLDAVKGEEA